MLSRQFVNSSKVEHVVMDDLVLAGLEAGDKFVL